ncbi:MAG: 2-dehydropantoate 2-reductase [Deltaproteobacteria bacterium]|nr:MAG: 2-dehydropantoate 2-reductase [Deltaproteobacteria bacterium]
MKIGIMGSGAVGSYFGAMLAKAGVDVFFVARGEHLARMKYDGLKVRSIKGDFDISVRATDEPEAVGECDLILFCVKSHDTVTAARQMAPMLGKSTIVISLQNGVDNEEVLGRIIGPERIIGGLCYIGARVDRPGEVIHSAAGRIIIGEYDGRRTVRLARAESLFADADVEVAVAEDINVEQWKKLCWNLSFNSISALTRSTVGEIIDNPETRQCVVEAISEAVRVASGVGVALPEDLAERIIASNAQFSNLRTSMLQDVEKGRPLEAKALNGVVCRYGKEHGVDTPTNRTLYGLLLCLDASLRR